MSLVPYPAYRQQSSFKEEISIVRMPKRNPYLQYVFREAVWRPLSWKPGSRILPYHDQETHRIIFEQKYTHHNNGYLLDISGHCLRIRLRAFTCLIDQMHRFEKSYSIPVTLMFDPKSHACSFDLRALKEGEYDAINNYQQEEDHVTIPE